MLITSGFEFEGYFIEKYHGVFTGEVALGTGFLSEFKAGLSDLFGVESEAFRAKLDEATQAALEALEAKAGQAGANALIGIRINHTMFISNMIGVVATGTAVTALPKQAVALQGLENSTPVPVVNYSLESSIRTCLIAMRKDGLVLEFASYVKPNPEMVQCTVSLLTVFGDALTLNKCELTLHQHEDILISEPIPVDFSGGKRRFASGRVTIHKVMVKGQVQSVPAQECVSALATDKLLALKQAKAKDAVQELRKNGKEWACYCGSITARPSCPVCGRQFSTAHFNLGTFISVGEERWKTAADGLAELHTMQGVDHFQYSRAREIAEKMAKAERIYGNMKQSLVKELIKLSQETVQPDA